LLNLLHSQWRALGVPFSSGHPLASNEAVDPEALLWCSLEFFPTQPRLCEQVLAWWAGNEHTVLRPRIRGFARTSHDPRAFIWRALDAQWKPSLKPPPGPCYGQKSVEELFDFCRDTPKRVRAAKIQRQRSGVPERTPATIILRARDVIGADARHFLLVYLLANHGGARLRSVASWSGQSYRNISKVAQRWKSANVISLEHGYARLRNPAIWTAALELDRAPIVLLNWRRLYDACIHLLRSINQAAARSIPADGPVVTALIREAAAEAAASIESDPTTPSETVQSLTELLAGLR
jgi:predicted transcriptional regulator